MNTKTDVTTIERAFAALSATAWGTVERGRAVDALMAALDANPDADLIIRDTNGNSVHVHGGRFTPIRTLSA